MALLDFRLCAMRCKVLHVAGEQTQRLHFLDLLGRLRQKGVQQVKNGRRFVRAEHFYNEQFKRLCGRWPGSDLVDCSI